jgi:hypothetical protein
LIQYPKAITKQVSKLVPINKRAKITMWTSVNKQKLPKANGSFYTTILLHVLSFITNLKVNDFFKSLEDFKLVNQLCSLIPQLSTHSTFVFVIISRNEIICSWVTLYMRHTYDLFVNDFFQFWKTLNWLTKFVLQLLSYLDITPHISISNNFMESHYLFTRSILYGTHF